LNKFALFLLSLLGIDTVMTLNMMPPAVPGGNTPADLLRQRLGLIIPADRLAVFTPAWLRFINSGKRGAA